MTNIKGEAYEVTYDPADGQVVFEGTLRLNGLTEYAPITALLSNAMDEKDRLVLDLQNLEFLNSSGIAMLSKFVIEARKRESLSLTIKGSKEIAWQGKSLVNLQRLMPPLELVLA